MEGAELRNQFLLDGLPCFRGAHIMGGVVGKLKIDQIRAALSKLSNVEFQLTFFLPIFVSDQRKASLTVRLRKIFANLRVGLRSRATTKRHSAIGREVACKLAERRAEYAKRRMAQIEKESQIIEVRGG